MASLGLMFRRNWPAGRVAHAAADAEGAGLDELWVVEDLGFHGGFTQAAIALSATASITVGLGIIPAPVRNAAFAAMEASTLASAFPGRFHLGIGHGVGAWITQVGAMPASQMQHIEHVSSAVRGLLHGATVSSAHGEVALDNVALVAAPSHPPLVSLGVQGPKGLALAGRIADGVILGEGATPAATAAARVAIGREARLTVFVVATQSADAAMRHIVTEGFCGSPPPPIEELALTGHPSTWRRQSDVWLAAGADTVVCCGVPDDPADVPDGLS